MVASKGHRVVLRGAVYYIVWPGNTRGRSTGTGNRKIADQQLAAFILSGDPAEVTGSDLTVSQMFEDYMIEHARPKTAAARQAAVAQGYFAAHFQTGQPAAAVTEDDLDAYMAARRAGKLKITRDPKPAGDGSLRREMGVLMAAYNHAVRKKRLTRGNVPHVSLPPAPNPKDRWLTPPEEDALIAACPIPPEGDGRLTRVYRFVMLALDTAARKDALENLTWTQIDFQAGTIALNPAARLQTNKRRSVVPMSRRLRAVLERAHRERENNFVMDMTGDVREAFKTAVRRAGLQDVTPHTLRHTWATRAMRAGVPPHDVAGVLGDDLKTVMKNYYHHHPDYMRGAADWRERETR